MEKKTRRAVLFGGAASTAALAAQALPAKAASGDPLNLGQANRSGLPTVVEATSRLNGSMLLTLRGYADAPTLRVENLWQYDDGTGLDVQTEGATGLRVRSNTGRALEVDGPTVFSRSGRAIIRSGRDRVRVESVALVEPGTADRSSAVLATLQVDLGDVFLKAAIPLPADGAIVLRLSGPAPMDAPVAWFVLD